MQEKSRSKVSVMECKSYDFAEKIVQGIFTDLEIEKMFVNKKVLLKVNLMLADVPEKSVNTHPEFVRAVIRNIKRLGGYPYIGESSGAYGFTKEAFEISGIAKVAQEENVEMINFDACPSEKAVISGTCLTHIYLPKILRDMEVLVSLPKLKTHRQLLYTGALKNLVGLIPGSHKVSFHLVSRNLNELAQAIIDLNCHVKFHLGIMDGVWGMEGNGPTSGSRRESRFIAASRDLVALDSVCSHLMGFRPQEILTNRIAAERGLGNASLGRIEISGDFPAASLMPFQRPQDRLKLRSNPVFFKWRSKLISPYPIRDLCKNCHQCVRFCPTGAIGSVQVRIDMKKCIRCYSCYENCTSHAIKLKCLWFLKASLKKKLRNFSLKDLV